MRLVSFKVQGFKNLRQPIVLDDLGPMNVIHGPNNIGKSNLLQAIELFTLIGLQDDSGIPLQRLLLVSDDSLAQAGFPRTEVFNLEVPGPIRLEAEVILTPEDIERAGLTFESLPLDRLTAALELRWMGTHIEYRIQQFKIADGRDFAVVTRSMAEQVVLSVVAKAVSQNLRIGADDVVPRFARIGVERLDSPELALALYDAKESSEIEISRRWERFVEAIAAFKDILGEGTFVATYDRKAKQANLLYQTARARIPLRLLGSGVQQLAAVLGTLLVRGATIAGIEEPELNLRYTLQRRLREVLANLVGVPGGMDQLFLTSHSDAFEAGPHFYLMEATPDGPRVEKRAVELARAAIGLTTDGLPPDPNAALCYLSTEGVVRVPERIRDALKLPHGGGVIFLERGGSVEMMSDKTFADRFEPKRDEKNDEQS